MKRVTLLLIAALLLVLTACGGGTTPTQTGGTGGTGATASPTTATADATPAGGTGTGLPDLGGREVRVAVENAYLPFNYIDPNTGQGAGWDYDAWREICRLLNCTPVFVEAAWEGMIQAVADGQYDAAADGITITEQRAEIVDFSEGYIAIQQRLLVRADETRFSSVEELQANPSYRIGSQPGTTNYETAVELFGEDRIAAYEQFPFAVQALITGDVDAVLMDETAGLGYVGVNAEQLKLVGDPLSSEQLGFIFPKGSDLVEPVNQALQAMRQSGYLDQLADTYFTENFTITYDDIFPEEE
jgi:polar amino acid transport system substrate-binding protein